MNGDEPWESVDVEIRERDALLNQRASEMTFDINLLEFDEEGNAIYYHSPDCPNYCDFACNGRTGQFVTEVYNAGKERRLSEGAILDGIGQAPAPRKVAEAAPAPAPKAKKAK